MKSKNKTQQRPAWAIERDRKEAQRKNLISIALEKWDVSDIMNDIDDLATSKDDKNSLRWWAELFLSVNASSIIIRPQSIAEADRIKELLDSVYPNENDKQMALFAA
jgi:hypothetical protein